MAKRDMREAKLILELKGGTAHLSFVLRRSATITTTWKVKPSRIYDIGTAQHLQLTLSGWLRIPSERPRGASNRGWASPSGGVNPASAHISKSSGAKSNRGKQER